MGLNEEHFEPYKPYENRVLTELGSPQPNSRCPSGFGPCESLVNFFLSTGDCGLSGQSENEVPETPLKACNREIFVVELEGYCSGGGKGEQCLGNDLSHAVQDEDQVVDALETKHKA